MLEDDLTGRISCTFGKETKLKRVVIAITRIMGLSSRLQQQTSTMKLISLLLAILHASEAVNGEISFFLILEDSDRINHLFILLPKSFDLLQCDI